MGVDVLYSLFVAYLLIGVFYVAAIARGNSIKTVGDIILAVVFILHVAIYCAVLFFCAYVVEPISTSDLWNKQIRK